MKLPQTRLSCDGFALLEVFVMLLLIFIVALMLLPPGPYHKRWAPMAQCMNNQKQMALGFVMWAGDNTNQFPWQVAATNGGTMEDASRGYAAANFRALDAYMKAPFVFICPTDKVKTRSTDVAAMHNTNISYFVGLDFNTNAAACILTGDRDLRARQSPVLPGLFVHTNGLAMGWTRELHGDTRAGVGVMSFYDGHVEVIAEAKMDSVFDRSGLSASRFDVP